MHVIITGASSGIGESLRGELMGTGVHVVTVYPGIIPTDMGNAGKAAYKTSAALKMQPEGTTTRLAELVYKAVDKRRDRVIYPAMNKLARHMPAATRWLMDRLTPELSEQ